MKSLSENATSFSINKWLELTKADADFLSIKLSDSERKDHVPRVLDVVAAILDGGEILTRVRV
jgi:hypothetical protein